MTAEQRAGGKRRWLFPIFWLLNIVCFLLIYPPIITYFNKPVAVLGLPLVYVWTTGVGIVWMVGAFLLGFLAEGYF